MSEFKEQVQHLVIRLFIQVQYRVLGLIRILFFKKRSASPLSARSILVFRSSALGDFICALPALHLLRKHFPEAKIVLLSTPTGNAKWRNKKLVPGAAFLADRLVDRKIIIPSDKLMEWQTIEAIRLIMKSYDFDLCLLLPFSGEGFLGRLKKMIYLKLLGVHGDLYGTRFSSSLSFFRQHQFAEGKFEHQITAALQPLREIGIYDQEIVFDIDVPRPDEEVIENFWKKHNLIGQPIVVIHPGSNHKVKQWPIDNFKLLGQMLLKLKPNLRLVIVGGKEDEATGELLIESWGKHAVNLAGKAAFLPTASIFRRCRLFIGNDSGPMHLAAAVGTPVIGIFSSICFPVFWKPWGKHSKAIRHSVPCEFCFTDSGDCPKKTYECIRGITVQEVFRACLPYIEMNEIIQKA